jgi:hypothetical protein
VLRILISEEIPNNKTSLGEKNLKILAQKINMMRILINSIKLD